MLDFLFKGESLLAYFFFGGLILLGGFLTSATSIIMVWLCLFFSTLLTSLWLLFEVSFFSLKYFMLQELFSGLCLFSLLVGSSSVGFLLGLWFKLGLPPSHSWFLSFLYKLGDISWFLTFSKVAPVYFLYSGLSFSYMLLFCLVLMVLFFLFSCVSFKSMLFFSSCLNFVWGALASFVSFFLSFIWVLFYFSVNFFLLYFTCGSLENIFLLLGLPPSFIFFLKLVLVFLVVQGGLFLFFFLVSTLLLFFKYSVLLEGQVSFSLGVTDVLFSLLISLVFFFFF